MKCSFQDFKDRPVPGPVGRAFAGNDVTEGRDPNDVAADTLNRRPAAQAGEGPNSVNLGPGGGNK